MAKLLYRLGFFSSRRPWVAIVSWLTIMVLSVLAFVTFGGTLTSAISIPNTPTAQVTERLERDYPDAAGGAGVVVFRTSDGSGFTDGQSTAVSELLSEVGEVDEVDAIMDPFETERSTQDQRDELAQGRSDLSSGREELAEGQRGIQDAQEQLATVEAELDNGQEQLDQARVEAAAAGAPASTMTQFDAQQEQLDTGREQLATGREEAQAGLAELETAEEDIANGEAGIERGEAMLALVGDFPSVSEDSSAAIGMVMFEVPAMDLPSETKDYIVDTLLAADIEGVDVLPSLDLSNIVPNMVGPAEVVGIIIAAIVLFLVLGTMVAAGLPLLTALIGVGIGVPASLAFSGLVEMVSVTPVLGLMLGLAVGIDYALFIISRHRQQLKDGVPLHESIGLASGTSGNAVLFAGLTVVIALAALNVTGIPFLAMMGTVAAVCVTVAVLVALTLTPALLGLTGYRVLRKSERKALTEGTATGGTGSAAEAKAVRPMSNARAVLVSMVAVVVLGVMAIPFFSIRLGLPDGASEAVGSPSEQAYVTIAEEFGDGRNGPLIVTVDLPEGLDSDETVDHQVAVGGQLRDLDHVAAVVPASVSYDNRLAMFQVIPEEGPNGETTGLLVDTLRQTEPVGDASNLAVAGATSGAIDVADKLMDSLPLYLGIVIGLSLVIMVLVFRSILLPLVATGGFILSVFAAMGGVVAIYQWGWFDMIFGVHNPAPLAPFIPTIMVGVLFGLAMDYQLFISSGMREAYIHGLPARRAVQQGLRSGRAVVSAAAIIMISVFGGFIFAESSMIRPMGFGLAFGVLVDAFVVRLLLVPAVLHLLGDSAWWIPRWLDRIMPNVDVEGASLERHPSPGDADARGTGVRTPVTLPDNADATARGARTAASPAAGDDERDKELVSPGA